MARTPDPRGNRPAWTEDADDAPAPRTQRQSPSPARGGGGGEPSSRRRGSYEAQPQATTTLKRSWIWLAILAMLLLGVGIAVGIAVVAKRSDAPIPVQANGGEAPLIPSPGPWKAKPTDPGGAAVEGQGQVIYDAGDGADPGGTIDLDALPEEPVSRPGTVAPGGPTDLLPPGTPVARPAQPQAQQPALPAAAPQRTPPPPAAQAPRTPAITPPAAQPAAAPAAPPTPPSGSSTVQLGAFSSEAAARTAWKSFAARFTYLRDLTPVILPVKVEDRTLYRLRATGAPDATDVCKRLRVAGETCAVV